MRKGFTLIELLVVVLIMGILVSVALPQYFLSVEKSRTAEASAVLESIASAQERYYMKTGTYATKLSELDIGISNLTYFSITSITATHNDGYISFRAQRKEEAGAGLGKYLIALQMPPVPGTGSRRWNCSRLPKCLTLLQGENIYGQSKQ